MSDLQLPLIKPQVQDNINANLTINNTLKIENNLQITELDLAQEHMANKKIPFHPSVVDRA